jgi:rare lipoprotein A
MRPLGPHVLGLLLLVGCAPAHPPREPVGSPHTNATHERFGHRGAPPDQVGWASWYGSELAGHRTASGERFDPSRFTGAHRELPFGTWVEVRRIDTGRTVRVRINDRGPNGKARRRVIDVSRRAAEDLGLVNVGVAPVELRVVDGP